MANSHQKQAHKEQTMTTTTSNFMEQLAEVEQHFAASTEADNNQRKGDWLESAVRFMLASDPDVEWAVFWEDWQEKRKHGFPQTDTGIDIVARRHDGSYMAVQTKCYHKNKQITLHDINHFLSASDPKPFTERYFIHTGKSLGRNASQKADQVADNKNLIIWNRYKLASRMNHLGIQCLGTSSAGKSQWGSARLTPKNLYNTKPYQQEAINDVIAGFQTSDRGKLIMPCGTGKTFMAQKIAEQIAGKDGLVLVAVPSISLLTQFMREWSNQVGNLKHKYIAVCSDKTAGKKAEADDRITTPLWEMDKPATTNVELLTEQLQSRPSDAMTVVFSTYHSLAKVQAAQTAADVTFDLLICDEAHRTAGLKKEDGGEAMFQQVHDPNFLKATKRLYATATPKVYVAQKGKKEGLQDKVYGMDDEAVYGPEFHIQTFGWALTEGLLTPYKVVIVGIEPDQIESVNEIAQKIVATGLVGEDDNKERVNVAGKLAAKIIGAANFLAGKSKACWGNKNVTSPLQRSLSFANTINKSKATKQAFEEINSMTQAFNSYTVEAEHIDCNTAAHRREEHLMWLRDSETDPTEARILTNAQCLSEGVDVPSLDAVVFVEPKKSQIDTIQAVGRVMRKAEGKDIGYIVLPVLTSPPQKADGEELSPQEIEKHITREWKSVWDVCRALAAYDENFQYAVHAGESVTKGGGLMNGSYIEMCVPQPWGTRSTPAASKKKRADVDTTSDQQLLINDSSMNMKEWKLLQQSVYQVLSTTFGKDMSLERAGDIAGELVANLKLKLKAENKSNPKVQKVVDRYHQKMLKTCSELLQPIDTIEMLAQHVIMEPVFKLLFEDEASFSTTNPVGAILDDAISSLDIAMDIIEERDIKLADFYHQIKTTIKAMEKDSIGYQSYIKDIWNRFFRCDSFKPTAKKFGIAYSPVEVVDFILRSSDWALHEIFGKRLTDQGVGIQEPFAGAGTFITRLLSKELGLINPEDVQRKYEKEISACEVLLLAYYVASTNIQQQYQQRMTAEGLEPQDVFPNIVLRDTFGAFSRTNKAQTLSGQDGNTAKGRKQDKQPVHVIFSNPPFTQAQDDAGDNAKKPEWEQIRKYAKENIGGHLCQTSWVHSLIYSEDRFNKEEGGVIGFIIPAGWIRNRSGEGIRKWVTEKFSDIWIVDCLGDAFGDTIREGASILGGDVQSSVGIFIFGKDPERVGKECNVKYTCIAPSLNTYQKREWINNKVSVKGFQNSEWKNLHLDKDNHWLRNFDPRFKEWIPLFNKDTNLGKSSDAIFRLESLGIATGRDFLATNSDMNYLKCVSKKTVNEYITTLASNKAPDVNKNIDIIKWLHKTLQNLSKKVMPQTDILIKTVQMRPFFPQYTHWDSVLNSRHYKMDKIFPEHVSNAVSILQNGQGGDSMVSYNLSGCNSLGHGSQTSQLVRYLKKCSNTGIVTSHDTSLMSSVPPLNFALGSTNVSTKFLPRFSYRQLSKGGAFEVVETEVLSDGYELEDNITESSVNCFQEHYSDDSIDGDALFFYCYGILNHKRYLSDHADSLAVNNPRIPFAPDFVAVRDFGFELARLHLSWQELDGLKLQVVASNPSVDVDDGESWRFKKLKFADKNSKDTIVINDNIRITGIPVEAHVYKINGKSPLEWVVNNYKIVQHYVHTAGGFNKIKQDRTGELFGKDGSPKYDRVIVNDPNCLFESPKDIYRMICQLAEMSIKTADVLKRLAAVPYDDCLPPTPMRESGSVDTGMFVEATQASKQRDFVSPNVKNVAALLEAGLLVEQESVCLESRGVVLRGCVTSAGKRAGGIKIENAGGAAEVLSPSSAVRQHAGFVGNGWDLWKQETSGRSLNSLWDEAQGKQPAGFESREAKKSFQALLEAGLLAEGEQLTAKLNGSVYEATVTSKGIEAAGTRSDSFSAAFRAASGKIGNGWTKWHTQNGESMNQLWKQAAVQQTQENSAPFLQLLGFPTIPATSTKTRQK